jgi:hypothetical protein
MKSSENFFSVWRRELADANWTLKTHASGFQPDRDYLKDLERWNAAVEYVQQAPKLKAKVPAGRQRAFERDVLLRARQAQSLGRSVIAEGLDRIRQLSASGLLDRGFSAWKNAVTESGSMSVHEVWDTISKMDGVRAILREHGLSESSLQNIDQTLAKYDQVHSIDSKGRLLSRAKESGQQFVLLDPSLPKHDRNVTDLFNKNQFDLVASRFSEPGKVAADVILRETEQSSNNGIEINILDGVLATSIMCQRELNRQVCELEESGIPEQEGDLAGWIIALIVVGATCLTLLIAGSILMAVCFREGDETYCTAAAILIFLGVQLFATVLFIVGAAALGVAPVVSAVAFGAGIAMVIGSIEFLALYFGGAESGELSSGEG